MRPLATPLAVGDGFVTCVTVFGPNQNTSLAGLVLADGAVFGSGAQVATINYTQAFDTAVPSTFGQQNAARAITGWNTTGTTTAKALSPRGIPTFVRLALIAANTWRCDISPDGVTWRPGTNLVAAVIPTHVGLLSSDGGGGAAHTTSYEFLRRVSGVT